MPTRHTLPLLLLAALLAQGAVAQTPAGPAQFIVPPSTQNQFLASVAMDGTGNLTFLWSDYLSGAVYTRRFSKDDVPLGPTVRLEPPRYGTWAGTVVANQRGDVLMTWSRGRGSGPAEFILRRTSPVLRTLTLKLKGAPDIAVDNKGNFVAIWVASTPDGTRVFGQRYNSDGTARGPEFNVATSTHGINKVHTAPSVAMNPATGGAAETVIAFGAAGEIPLLGDFDGDGRDDACVFAHNTFRCDTAHNGGAAEAVLTVNGPGRPLIGNVDGL
jgi:hypothetical protein